jgi:hypothetical protein
VARDQIDPVPRIAAPERTVDMIRNPLEEWRARQEGRRLYKLRRRRKRANEIARQREQRANRREQRASRVDSRGPCRAVLTEIGLDAFDAVKPWGS